MGVLPGLLLDHCDTPCQTLDSRPAVKLKGCNTNVLISTKDILLHPMEKQQTIVSCSYKMPSKVNPNKEEARTLSHIQSMSNHQIGHIQMSVPQTLL